MKIRISVPMTTFRNTRPCIPKYKANGFCSYISERTVRENDLLLFSVELTFFWHLREKLIMCDFRLNIPNKEKRYKTDLYLMFYFYTTSLFTGHEMRGILVSLQPCSVKTFFFGFGG